MSCLQYAMSKDTLTIKLLIHYEIVQSPGTREGTPQTRPIIRYMFLLPAICPSQGW